MRYESTPDSALFRTEENAGERPREGREENGIDQSEDNDEARQGTIASTSKRGNDIGTRQGAPPRNAAQFNIGYVELHIWSTAVRECRPAGADVALLIDFGTLLRGVESHFDCEALFRFAGEHGRVVAANAYADWSADDMRGYRAALRGAGVEPVDVPGRSDPGREVCIRMAMDAVDLMWSAPQVGIYVIVAADGGLFPAVDALRRRGRKVVGAWPVGRWS